MRDRGRWSLGAGVALGLMLVAAACGSSGGGSSATTAASGTGGGGSSATTAAVAGGSTGGGGNEEVRLAVNPWTGSAVNANVAKLVIEQNGLGKVDLVVIDENAMWPAIAKGDQLDGVLEVWPSGHANDYDTYITGKKGVIDGGLLGANGKIGWYVPQFVVDEHPQLATWEGFKDPKLADLFKTAESGDKGQFLMGDPSYVSYDEQIIANLGLPLKFVVAGSEAALITAIQNAEADHKPLLVQFWQPQWLHSKVKLTEVKLPAFTDACAASAAANDGKYNCDYPVDKLYKAFNDKLEQKAPKSFAVLKNMQITTEQQNEIAAYIDSDGMSAADAAKKWVDANQDVWKAWLPA
jgi:glycine betaine/proline transport system substrate-binding protein